MRPPQGEVLRRCHRSPGPASPASGGSRQTTPCGVMPIHPRDPDDRAMTIAAVRDVVGADVAQVAADLGVDPAHGLTAEEARSRLASHGPNRLAAGKKEPGWRAFLRQYQDF